MNAEIDVSPHFRMATIKPLVLQWCIDSWTKMKEGRDLIKFGWHECCVRLLDVHDEQKRKDAVMENGRGELQVRGFIPEGDDGEQKGDDREQPESELILSDLTWNRQLQTVVYLCNYSC